MRLDSGWGYVVAAGMVCAIGFFLRTAWLPHESAWYDEICGWNHLDAPTLAVYLEAPETKPDDAIQFMKGAPVYFILQYYWARIAGLSVLAARLVPLVFGVAIVPLAMALACRLYTRRAALVTGWCCAFSQILIYYSQELRPYALVSFLALVSMYALIRAIEEGRVLWLFLHGAANGLMAFTHLFAVPLMAAQFLFLVLTRHRDRRRLALWVGGHAGLGAVLLAWVLTVDAESIGRTVTLYRRPSLHDIANVYLTYAGGRVSQLSPADFLPQGINLDALLALFCLGCVAWLGWTSLRREEAGNREATSHRVPPREAYLLLLLWLLAPVAFVTAMSYAWKPALNARYLAYCSLALYLLTGGGVAAIRSGLARAGMTLCLALLMGYQALAMAQGPFRPDYRTAAHIISTEAASDDRIFVLKDINLVGMHFYWPGAPDRLEVLGGEQDLFQQAEATHRQGHGFWVVMWRWDRLDRWEQFLTANGVTFEKRRLGGMPSLFLYRGNR